MPAALDPVLEADTDRRSVPRRDLSLGVTLRRESGGEVIPADIANLSATGFLAELPDGAQLPDILHVELPNAGHRKAHVVWSGGELAGCNFDVPLSKADLSAAQLKSARAEVVMDAEARAKELELQPSDPIFDTSGEVSADEKWPFVGRVAVIAIGGLACWAPLAGIAALLV